MILSAKSLFFVFVASATVGTTMSFIPTSASFITKTEIQTASSVRALHAYVPAGLTPEEYNRIREQDKQKLGKDLGRLGPRGFKSRSLQGFQEAMEKGEANHAFAPVGYKDMLQRKEIKDSDVPYMVRPGGSWDNADVKGSKKLSWSKTDRKYADGGYKNEQSSSIFGSGPGLDWTGSRKRDTNNRISFPGFN